jgi:hypothetical protein
MNYTHGKPTPHLALKDRLRERLGPHAWDTDEFRAGIHQAATTALRYAHAKNHADTARTLKVLERLIQAAEARRKKGQHHDVA